MNGFGLEVALHWATIAAYLVATALFAHTVVFRGGERSRIATVLTACGLALRSFD